MTTRVLNYFIQPLPEHGRGLFFFVTQQLQK